MGFAAEGTEHGAGFIGIMGFTEHLTIQPNDGICRDKELVRLEFRGIGLCLGTRDEIRNVTCLQISRIRFVGIDGDCRKRKAETGKEFTTTRRSGA